MILFKENFYIIVIINIRVMKKKKKINLSLNKFTVSNLTDLTKEKIIAGGIPYSQPGICSGGSGGGGTNTCAVQCNPGTTFGNCGWQSNTTCQTGAGC